MDSYESNLSLVTDQIQNLNIDVGEIVFMESLIIFNKITKHCRFSIQRINEKLSNERVFEEYYSKNNSITKTIWEKTFLLNRTFVLQNKQKYTTIIEQAVLNPNNFLKVVSTLSNNTILVNFTVQKLYKILLYFMFSCTSFFCEKPGILLKTITKQNVCDTIPIFGPIKSGKVYLIIDTDKVDVLVEELLV